MIKYLPELLKENVISQEVAENITLYYNSQKKQGQNKTILIFSVLGALLVGLGIILILSYNWDQYPIDVQKSLAFIPLFIAQVLCIYTILKKNDSVIWRESVSILLFFAFGASISLVSQIYYINGNISEFLLVWMVFTFPIIYLLNSSHTSLLFIIGITAYACSYGYDKHTNIPYLYFLFFIANLTHYYQLIKKDSNHFIINLFHSLFALSLILTLGTISQDYNRKELMYIAYTCMFGFLLLLESSKIFQKYKLQNKVFLNIGFVSTIIILFEVSSESFWKESIVRSNKIMFLLMSPEMLAIFIFTVITLILLFNKYKNQEFLKYNPIDFVFLAFILIYLIGYNFPLLAMIIINCLVLYLGIRSILKGIKSDHLGIMNLGLLIITILVILRFFDTNISFLIRGSLFVAVGIGFFLTNFKMLKKRKSNEN